MTTPGHADTLRRAAAHLRTLATAAAHDTGSTRWEARRRRPGTTRTSTTLHATGASHLLHGGSTGPGPFVTGPVGDHIAAMDPSLALALADHLDHHATTPPPGSPPGPAHTALTLARTLLNET